MRTSEQPTADLSDDVRHYTRLMADLCKRDPARFAALLRASDRYLAAGMSAEQVRRLTVDASGEERG